MSNIIPIDQAARALSPLARQRMGAGRGVAGNFQDGIRDAFPVLSIKGKVFRARISGTETPFIDPNTRQPIAYLDLVMVNASPTLAKTFYQRGFTEGDMNPPDCWSLDSIRPDPSVANKVSPVCGTCPMNAFGSRMTDAGKAAKACADARRVAVVMPHQIGDQQPMVLMLRVPQSSLKNLKAYAQLLERHGMEPAGVITRLAFDYQEAFPKLLFNFVAPLPDTEYQRVIDMAEGDMVSAMLAAPDFENAPSTQPVQQDNRITGLAPQQAPVLATEPSLSQPIQASSPIPSLETVPSNLIELPDGRLFDPATKQYVERTQPQVQMPQLDPNTLALPEGKFFNTVTKEYVTGPEIGAKAVVAEQPVKRERKKREGKAVSPAEVSPQQPEPQVQQEAAPPATGGQAVEDEEEGADNTPADGVKPVVQQASAPLSEMLKKLLPPTTH